MQANQTKQGVDDLLASIPGATLEQIEKALLVTRTDEDEAASSKAREAVMGWFNENVLMTTGRPFGKWYNKKSGEFVLKETIDEYLAKFPWVPTPDGPKPAGPYGRTSPLRPEVYSVEWEPAQPPEAIYTENGLKHYNTYKGFGLEPKKGDISWWNLLLDTVSKEQPELRTWIEQWAAAPLQQPGLKMFTALVLVGEEGSGKTMFAKVLGSLYGDYFSEVDQKTLHSNFTGWSAKKLFVLLDEVTAKDKREQADFLKGLITRDEAQINEKYQPRYEIKDHCNFVITSNNKTAVYIRNDKTRRWAVCNMPVEMPEDISKVIVAGYTSMEGKQALLDHLLHVNLDGFNPFKKAPFSQARQAMEEASRSAPDAFAFEMIENATLDLAEGLPSKLWRIERLIDAYKDKYGHLPRSSRALEIALKEKGAIVLPQVRLKDGLRYRFWALSNQDFWLETAKKASAGDPEAKKAMELGAADGLPKQWKFAR